MTPGTLLRHVLRRRALERELDAELRDHIEREIAEGVRGGQSEAEVRRQMRLTSGGLDQVKEACRDVRRPPALADLGADLRFAWRTLVKDRWFTAYVDFGRVHPSVPAGTDPLAGLEVRVHGVSRDVLHHWGAQSWWDGTLSVPLAELPIER
jgi:hypothetical protein